VSRIALALALVFSTAQRMQHDYPETKRVEQMDDYHIQTDAGHGAGKPTKMLIEAQADRWAFVMANLGMEWPEDGGSQR
jgi:hypothetical protein